MSRSKLPAVVPSEFTATPKDAIAEAAERLGGVDRLIAWVEEDPKNESVFWASIYPKLIPVQLGAKESNPADRCITVRFV
jgi:hypothetical protein